MTEITRVPLQPIARGSLTRIWLGVLFAVLAAGGMAWAAMPAQVGVKTLLAGSGPAPTAQDVMFVKYTGKLADGTVFDKSPDRPFPIPGILPEGVPMIADGVVPGFAQGLLQMHRGGKYELRIPASKAYGANPPQGSKIPPNADLVFEVEMIDFMPRPEAEQRMQFAQQMMQQAQQQGGKGGQTQGLAPPGARMGPPAAPHHP